MDTKRTSQARRAAKHEGRFHTTHGIVPALDLESLDEVCRVVQCTTDVEGVVAYKLGLTCTLRLGLTAAVEALRSITDLPIIYDHQKAGADVPDMAAKFTRTCKEAGVDGLILFPVAGPTAVRQFVGQALDHGLLPIVGGDLPLPDYNVRGGGFIANNGLVRIVEQSVSLGADHFVVPATDTRKLKRIVRLLNEHVQSPALFLPGIGALGGSISKAFAAAPECRLYGVIGRAIYNAADPAEAARTFAGEALNFA